MRTRGSRDSSESMGRRHDPSSCRKVVHITRHFNERWKQFVGTVPSLEGLNEIVAESSKLRGNMNVFRHDGRGLVHVKLLAEYWNHRIGVIIKVDEQNGHAVTIITPRRVEARDKQQRRM